jgi:hypothetical protein
VSRWFSMLGVLASIALTAGCAASAPVAGPGSTPYAQSVQRAAAYCKKKGLFLRMDAAPPPARPGKPDPELQFRCVKGR